MEALRCELVHFLLTASGRRLGMAITLLFYRRVASDSVRKLPWEVMGLLFLSLQAECPDPNSQCTVVLAYIRTE